MPLPTVQRGRFLTLEGIDGAGKSTHVPFIAEYLQQQGLTVCLTREPGGTVLGEQLRQLLLDPATEVSLKTETLLMFAARQEHLQQRIMPALARGEWVLCDRFTDSTVAFQGGGRGVSLAAIEQLEQWVHADLQPDLTFLFDVPTDIAHARRQQSGQAADRIEREADSFHQRVRQAYLQRAAAAPQRFHILDARCSVAELQQQIATRLTAFISEGQP